MEVSRGKAYYATHKEACKAASERWRSKNRDKMRQHYRKENRRKRTLILDLYGGGCACCGETRYEFLCVDHINGGGNRHRELKGTGHRMWKDIADEGYRPDKYRVLCHNCNMSMGAYGYCPHEKEREKVA